MLDWAQTVISLRVEILSKLTQKRQKLGIIFEEKLIKSVKMDGRAMQHACQMSLPSFLETIIDIFNYYYYAILRPKFHLSKHL